MKKILHNIENNWLLLVIVLQPILDILAFFTFSPKITLISFMARTMILLFILAYTFFKSQDRKKFILKLSPIFIFSLLHIINSYRVGYLSFFSDIRYLILVTQMPVIAICLIDYLKNNQEKIYQIKQGFIINVFIIFISVVLSILTNTYKTTYENYGLTGWFSSANTQSMILAITTPIFIYYYNKNKGLIKYIISNAIVVFLLFFNGTKACFLTLIFILMFMLYNALCDKNKKIRLYKFIISVLLITLVGLNFKHSNTFTRSESTKNNDEKTKEEVKDSLNKNFCADIRFEEDENNNKILISCNRDKTDDENPENESNGIGSTSNDSQDEENCESLDFNKLTKDEFIQVIRTSYYYDELVELFGEDKVYYQLKDKMSYSGLSDNRLRKRTYAKIINEDTDFFTKLVGFEFTQIGQYGMDLENDLTAIFYYYGYLGFGLYILFILYFICILLKNLIKNKKNIFNPEFIILFGTLVLVLVGGEYSGAFLRKPNANIYLSLLLVMIYFNYKNTLKPKNAKNNKITIMALHLKPGGIEKFISTTSAFLSKKYDVEVVSVYEYDKDKIVQLNKNVKVKYLLDKKYKPNKEIIKEHLANKKYLLVLKELIYAMKIIFLKNSKMKNYIKNCDSSIIISTRMEHNFILSEFAKPNVLKIVTEHNYYNDKYSEKIVNSCSNIDYFIVSTDDQKQHYEKLFNGLKPEVIKIPFALSSIPKESSKLDNYNLISVGRLSKEKGFDDMINIFSKLVKEEPKFNLKIIGYGAEEKNLSNQIKKLKLDKKVTLCGRKNSEEIEQELLNSSLFLLTSHTESFGIVLIEAMSCGVPCIIFDSAKGARELITNNYNGYVIENRNSKEYVDTIVRLFKNKKQLQKLGKNSKEKSNEFNIKEIEKQWFNILEK